jgi:hypothetical protein
MFTVNQTLAAFQVGVLLNRFEWYGSQAWLTGDPDQGTAALHALDELTAEVPAIAREGASEDLRHSIVVFRERFPNELAVGYSAVFQRSQHFDDDLDEESDLEACRQFHTVEVARPFFELLKEVTQLVERMVVPEAILHLNFGRSVDRGVRPDGIHLHLYHYRPPDPAEWTPASSEQTSSLWAGTLSLTAASSVLAPTPVNRLANTVLNEARVSPRPGWITEVQRLWGALFPTRSLAAGIVGATDIDALKTAYFSAVRAEEYVVDAGHVEESTPHPRPPVMINRLGLSLNEEARTASRHVNGSPRTVLLTPTQYLVLHEILRFDVSFCPSAALTNILAGNRSNLPGAIQAHVSDLRGILRNLDLFVEGKWSAGYRIV